MGVISPLADRSVALALEVMDYSYRMRGDTILRKRRNHLPNPFQTPTRLAAGEFN